MAPETETAFKIPNSAKAAAKIWWVMGALFIGGIFVLFFLEMSGTEVGDWKYGVGFLFVIAGATSLVMAVIYMKRSGVIKGIQLNKDVLAHWTYTAEEWAQYTRKEHLETKREKKNLFLLVAAISVIIGGIITAIEPGDWMIFLFTVAGIIIIAGGSALLAVWLSYRQNHKHRGEAFITRDALVLNGVLHLWKGMGSRLNSVEYHGYKRKIPVISFSYSVPARYGTQNITVRVPVPEGRGEEALKLAAQFGPDAGNPGPELIKD